MGVIEETRQLFQDFLAPELREIRSQVTALGQRMDNMEEMNRIRHEALLQRFELIQQSFAFDKRISELEAERRRTA